MRKALFFLFVAFMMLSMRGLAQSSCNAPTGLTASLHAPEWNNVLLNWNAVVDSTQQDIMWSTTTMSTRIGADAAADHSQRPVPGVVAQLVIGLLQPVDIRHDNAKGIVFHFLKVLDIRPPVFQSGQRHHCRTDRWSRTGGCRIRRSAP